MGGTKRMLETHEAKRVVALRIALEAGTTKRCEFHDDCIFEGTGDLHAAYKLGNSMYTAGKLGSIFESRREMTDVIKEVVEDHLADDCPRCEKHRDED